MASASSTDTPPQRAPLSQEKLNEQLADLQQSWRLSEDRYHSIQQLVNNEFQFSYERAYDSVVAYKKIFEDMSKEQDKWLKLEELTKQCEGFCELAEETKEVDAILSACKESGNFDALRVFAETANIKAEQLCEGFDELQEKICEFQEKAKKWLKDHQDAKAENQQKKAEAEQRTGKFLKVIEGAKLALKGLAVAGVAHICFQGLAAVWATGAIQTAAPAILEAGQAAGITLLQAPPTAVANAGSAVCSAGQAIGSGMLAGGQAIVQATPGLVVGTGSAVVSAGQAIGSGVLAGGQAIVATPGLVLQTGSAVVSAGQTIAGGVGAAIQSTPSAVVGLGHGICAGGQAVGSTVIQNAGTMAVATATSGGGAGACYVARPAIVNARDGVCEVVVNCYDKMLDLMDLMEHQRDKMADVMDQSRSVIVYGAGAVNEYGWKVLYELAKLGEDKIHYLQQLLDNFLYKEIAVYEQLNQSHDASILVIDRFLQHLNNSGEDAHTIGRLTSAVYTTTLRIQRTAESLVPSAEHVQTTSSPSPEVVQYFEKEVAKLSNLSVSLQRCGINLQAQKEQWMQRTAQTKMITDSLTPADQIVNVEQDRREIVKRWADVSEHQKFDGLGEFMDVDLPSWETGKSMCGIAFHHYDLMKKHSVTRISAITTEDLAAVNPDCGLPEGVEPTQHVKFFSHKTGLLHQVGRLDRRRKVIWVLGFAITETLVLKRTSCANYLESGKRGMSHKHYNELYFQLKKKIPNLRKDTCGPRHRMRCILK